MYILTKRILNQIENKIFFSFCDKKDDFVFQIENTFQHNDDEILFHDNNKNYSLLQSFDHDNQMKKQFLDFVDSIQHHISRFEFEHFIFNHYSKDNEIRNMKFIYNRDYNNFEHHIYYFSNKKKTIFENKKNKKSIISKFNFSIKYKFSMTKCNMTIKKTFSTITQT